MSDEPPRPEAFQALYESLHLDARSLAQPVDTTFIPERAAPADPALDSLPRLAVAGEGERGGELRFGVLLGEGGRGQVRLARQLSLRRDVAVKSLKGDAGTHLKGELLREARITGGLEHPNVVPVYALGRGAGDELLLVMKRVGGVPWSEQLAREGPARTDAAMERQLEILRQVCNAVEFAHSRGIVHRDLKPANVMVGSFGEVVVLDWGLALSLEGDPERGLPPASEVKGLCGTPSYMAPELVVGEGRGVGPWTDVYLLGAMLHQIVTGAPPHRGGSLPLVLEKAFASAPPEYGPEVPAEVAALCRRAMARDPKARFPSVATFSEAIRDLSRHRQSVQLALEAQKRLDGLPALGASPGGRATRAGLAQSRFGFEQALRSWPESPVAAAGLQQMLVREVREAVAERNAPLARAALAELVAPGAALTAEVDALDALLAAQAAEERRIKVLAHELNPNVSNAARNVLFVIIGLVWCVVPIGFGTLERAGVYRPSLEGMLAGVLPWLGFATLVMWRLRDGLLKNRMGRRMTLALFVAVFAAGLTRLTALLLATPVHAAFAFELAVYAVIGAMGALVDLRFGIGAGVYALAAVAAGLWPDQAFFILAAANLLALVPMALGWEWLESRCPNGWTLGSLDRFARDGR